MKTLILFAHGSRDPNWADPFEKIKALCAIRFPNIKIALAYLGLMSPTLAQCIENLATSGHTQFKVVPLFLGQGGHLRQDLPQILADVRARWPHLEIDQSPCVGLDEIVLSTIADFCCRQISL